MAVDAQGLGDFVRSLSGERTRRVEESLGDGYVRLVVEEAERRQAKHDIRHVEDVIVELLRNARDAGARRIFVATARDGDRRSVVVLDDGCGIPQEMHEAVFEARVTSKLNSLVTDRWGVHGRGMALYSIRENAEDARVMASEAGRGCALRVTIDTTSLPERADQSSWPRLGRDDDGVRGCTRGPHNIPRACCEFALEEHERCSVFLGSPAEVVSSVRARVRGGSEDGAQTVLEPLVEASGAAQLCEAAASLGLDISSRTAHRVLSGEIRPLPSVYARLLGPSRSRKGSGQPVDLFRDARSLRLSDDDADAFAKVMEADFPLLGDAYFLTLTGPPKVSTSRGKVVVTFDVREQD